MSSVNEGPYLWIDEWVKLDDAANLGSYWVVPPEKYLSVGAARYLRINGELTTAGLAGAESIALGFETSNAAEPASAISTASPWNILAYGATTAGTGITTPTVVLRIDTATPADCLLAYVRLNATNQYNKVVHIRIRLWVTFSG